MNTRIFAFLLCLLLLAGCAPKVKLFGSQASDPLQEVVVQGEGGDKLALIYLKGFLASQPSRGTFRTTPSQVQEVVSALALAEADDEVKGVVLAIDSPGGTTTASDMLYHEITDFKKRSGKKVVVAMFDVATSGGYYTALPADWIMAHPTTITGSVGVIFLRPKLHSLFGKIGVDVEVSKSGRDKDMGSPFRPTTEEEVELFDGIIADFAQRFHSLVALHRRLDAEAMETVRTARIFTARQAEAIGLVDEVGYIQDAFTRAGELCGMTEPFRVISYRRDVYPNDNAYNTLSAIEAGKAGLLGIDASFMLPPKAGFYYVWPQGLTQ